MENVAFSNNEENHGDSSGSENSILSNAVFDSETDSNQNPRATKPQSTYFEEVIANQRRTSFELDVFRTLDKIDVFPGKSDFIDEDGDQYKIMKNLEDLYFIIFRQKEGKLVDNFLRNLFEWSLDGDCVDVKDSFGYNLARVLKNDDLSFR